MVLQPSRTPVLWSSPALGSWHKKIIAAYALNRIGSNVATQTERNSGHTNWIRLGFRSKRPTTSTLATLVRDVRVAPQYQ